MDLYLTLEQAATGVRSDLRIAAGSGATVADLAGSLADSMAEAQRPADAGVEEIQGVISLDRRRTALSATPPAASLSTATRVADGLWLGARRLDPSLDLLDAGLRDGAVLGLGGPVGAAAQEPVGVVELRIVGGPAAGTVHRLGPGEYSLGSVRTRRLGSRPRRPRHALSLTVRRTARSSRAAPTDRWRGWGMPAARHPEGRWGHRA